MKTAYDATFSHQDFSGFRLKGYHLSGNVAVGFPLYTARQIKYAFTLFIKAVPRT